MIQRRQVLFCADRNFSAKIREKDDNTFEIKYSNRKRNNLDKMKNITKKLYKIGYIYSHMHFLVI